MATPDIPIEDAQSPTGNPIMPTPESPEARDIPTQELIRNMMAQRQPADQPEELPTGEIDLSTQMGQTVAGVAMRQEQDSKFEEYKIVYPELTRGEFNRSQLAESQGRYAEAHTVLTKATIRGTEINNKDQKDANKNLAVQGPSAGDTSAPVQINSMEDATQAAKSAARGY